MSSIKDSFSATDSVDIQITRGTKQPEPAPSFKPVGQTEVEPLIVTYPVDFNIKNKSE